MQVIYISEVTGHRVTLIRELSHEREAAELELLASGVALPMTSRTAWAKSLPKHTSWGLVVHDATGKACGGIAIDVSRSRVLPGHLVLHVSKLGISLPHGARVAALSALKKLALQDSRVLRLHVSIFSQTEREVIASELAELGFARAVAPISYRHTLRMDLTPTVEGIFALLHKTARKNIQGAAKMQDWVLPITDLKYAQRIEDLRQAAFHRTGGSTARQDWSSRIAFSAKYPDLSRIVGCFVSEDLHPDSLSAFGWGCAHGDHVEYRAAGSIQLPNNRIPLSYPILWDLIQWGKSLGMEWFDLGGVTVGDSQTDPLGGISSFKRYFSREIIQIGDE